MSTWIDIKSKTPEPGQWAAVCGYIRSGVGELSLAIGQWQAEGYFVFPTDEYGLDVVTHWIPLPSLPKVVKS